MTETGASQIFLGRQPILGREQQLLAYELLFRDGNGGLDNKACFEDPTQATATVIANAFTELSTSGVLGPYRAFINVDHALLFSDLIEALPTRCVALEIIETIEPSPDVIARCRFLHDLGFTLVLDDLAHIGEADHPLLSLVDIIKIDITAVDPAMLPSLVGEARRFARQLLAEKVETHEQYAACISLGFDLFQGYFFAKPTVIVGKKLNPSQLTLLRLLTLIMEDAETSALENAFKLEPGLTVNLLLLTNSVSSGLSTQITSLRHAITLLGRRQLQRWLQLLAYTDPKNQNNGTNPLMQLAATRGRLMERLSERLQPKNHEFADQAFMVGIMSLMPSLLGMNITDILAQLPLAQRVKNALTDYSGAHGHLLRLAEATEQTDPDALEAAIVHLPGITRPYLNQCLTEALYWANNLGQAQQAEAVEDASP